MDLHSLDGNIASRGGRGVGGVEGAVNSRGSNYFEMKQKITSCASRKLSAEINNITKQIKMASPGKIIDILMKFPFSLFLSPRTVYFNVARNSVRR